MDCSRDVSVLPESSTFDSGDCPVDWVVRQMDAARRESCGRCVLCREGTLQVFTIAESIAHGEGLPEDTALVMELLKVISTGLSCEMAADAAARCISALEAAPDTWEQHISRKRCLALVCRPLVTPFVSPERCAGCGSCIASCPDNAIAGGEGRISVVNAEKCGHCLVCVQVCPKGAIVKTSGPKPKGPAAPIPVGSWEAGGEGAGLRRRRRS
jgi:NADH-quinone oxidoreductase subunit F